MRLEKEAVAEMADMVVKMAEKMTSQAIAAFECSLRSYQPSIRCLFRAHLHRRDRTGQGRPII